MKKYTFFLDGKPIELTLDEASKYNVVVTKSNGYSHWWSAIEKFDKQKHVRNKICEFTGRDTLYIQKYLTTKTETEFIQGSSEVSFS